MEAELWIIEGLAAKLASRDQVQLLIAFLLEVYSSTSLVLATIITPCLHRLQDAWLPVLRPSHSSYSLWDRTRFFPGQTCLVDS